MAKPRVGGLGDDRRSILPVPEEQKIPWVEYVKNTSTKGLFVHPFPRHPPASLREVRDGKNPGRLRDIWIWLRKAANVSNPPNVT